MREQRVVVAVLAPMLESANARRGVLLALGFGPGRAVGVFVERLVLEELKTRFPADYSRLVRVRAQRRSIAARLLLDRVPWNEVHVDAVGRERVRDQRLSARRRVEGVTVRRVTGAIGFYDAAHVIDLYEEILFSWCRSSKTDPRGICSATHASVHRSIAVSRVLFPDVDKAVLVTALHGCADDNGAPGHTSAVRGIRHHHGRRGRIIGLHWVAAVEII